MQIKIIAFGLSKNSPYTGIIEDFIKITPWKIEVKELVCKKKLEGELLKKNEAELIEENIDNGAYIIVLDERGKQFTSTSFAHKLMDLSTHHSSINFIIGGAFGLAGSILQKAQLKMSLSDMTLPHMMARSFLVEQIYRAYTINNNHPYHK